MNKSSFETDEIDNLGEINREVEKLKAKSSEHYGEVAKCLMFHESIIG